MKEDPIVEEIHRVRRELLESCGNDLQRYLDHLVAKEKEEEPSRLVKSLEEARRLKASDPKDKSNLFE
jgi:hypothetical protein